MSCLPRTLHDPEAERWAVAAALVYPTGEELEAAQFYCHGHHCPLEAMLGTCAPDDFLDPLARAAWEAIHTVAQGQGLDAVNQLTVALELARRGVEEPFIATLSGWVAELPTPLLGIHAARLVREAAQRRRGLQRLQQEAQALAKGERAPPRGRAGGRLAGLVRR